MDYVPLGRTGLQVSRVCLGCMSYGQATTPGILQWQFLLNQSKRFCMKSRDSADQNEKIDNHHQKTVSGKKQHGPADKIGKDAGGAYGSRGQNRRSASSVRGVGSVGSHKPGGDGPGTKKFKHESDNVKRGKR